MVQSLKEWKRGWKYTTKGDGSKNNPVRDGDDIEPRLSFAKDIHWHKKQGAIAPPPPNFFGKAGVVPSKRIGFSCKQILILLGSAMEFCQKNPLYSKLITNGCGLKALGCSSKNFCICFTHNIFIFPYSKTSSYATDIRITCRWIPRPLISRGKTNHSYRWMSITVHGPISSRTTM